MASSKKSKVFEISNYDEFIDSLRTQAITDSLDSVSYAFFGRKNAFDQVIKDTSLYSSFININSVKILVDQYVFSTELHTTKRFIKPVHIDYIIHTLSTKLIDVIMFRLSELGYVDLCWCNNDFMWRINESKIYGII